MKGLRLEHSDVVFMYTPESPETYLEYGATMGAWGGATSAGQVKAARDAGVHPTGGMWCLTAGAKNLHDDPLLGDAVVRDIEGNPIPVPWLHDHVYEGTPTYWGCSSHPAFRAHLREEVCKAMRGGTLGLHIDDHLSTAHPALYEGGCFCDHCMRLFTEYLRVNGTRAMAQECGLLPKGGPKSEKVPEAWDTFDYRDIVRPLAPNRDACKALGDGLPLYRTYTDFQLSRAADNVRALGRLAEDIVQHPITLSANTGLPNPEHTVVVRHLTHMVGEVHHHANEGTRNLIGAVKAYRMAEALGIPLAATAAGQDWDHCLNHRSEGLVSLWVALGYACGQRLMVPHRMWCYSGEHGTRWYDGPPGVYAPLYRFVRANRRLFDGLETRGPLSVGAWPRSGLSTWEGRREFVESLEEPGAFGPPAPFAVHNGKVWLFPREGGGKAVIHALNLEYDPTRDGFTEQRGIYVDIPDPFADGPYASATIHSVPDGAGDTTPVGNKAGRLEFRIPSLGMWSIIELTQIP